MNKLKFFNDVVRTMKEKENWQGTLQVEATRDRVKLFDLMSQFDKNLAIGQGQSKIKLEFDCDGHKMKHESSNEFTLPTPHGVHCQIHHKLKEHWHCRSWQGAAGEKGGGFKAKLDRIALLLQLLSSFKLEQQADQSFVLSVNSADFSAELKQALRERQKQHWEGARQYLDGEPACGCSLIRELAEVEDHDLEFRALVSPSYSVLKLDLICKGTGKSQDNIPAELTLKAELNLA